MYVGVGAARVRELFAAARKKAPAIIFIDEIDAIGSRRSAKDQVSTISPFSRRDVGLNLARVVALYEADLEPVARRIGRVPGCRRSHRDRVSQGPSRVERLQAKLTVRIIRVTNFPQSLDNALTRPGRFDRHVTVPLPDMRGRAALLKHYMNEVEFDVEVDPSIIARGCPG